MSEIEPRIITITPIEVLHVWKEVYREHTSNYPKCAMFLADRLKVLDIELQLDKTVSGVDASPNTRTTPLAIEVAQLVRKVNATKALRAKADGMPMTCNQVYEFEVVEVEQRPMDALRGCYFNHLSGVLDQDLHEFDLDLITTDGRIEVTHHKNFFFDQRRFWRLSSVWFDGKPVMVIQNAGREGDDFHARFITDGGAFVEMCSYLLTRLRTADNPQEKIASDIVDGDKEIGMPLIEFYGNELGGYFEHN